MYFTDQVVWITGASSGIGEALAIALSQAGAKIILSARRSQELERVKALCDRPDEHLVLPVDMSDFEAVNQSVHLAKAWNHRLDLVIQNAGISQRSLVKDTHFSVDERIMKVNYLGVVAHTKAILPWFLEQGKGQFVVISSLVGKFATPLRSAYAASKHALHGFFDAMRSELHTQNITVTILCPGYINTNISYHALTANGHQQGTLDQAQANGLSAESFAQRALKIISRGQAEAYIGGKERLGVWVHRFFPRLFRFLIRRVKVT